MAYVAVSGGEAAIQKSLELLRNELAATSQVSIAALTAALPELIDQIMGESSLYAPHLAALALKQGGGSVEEAVFLLRAYRSTLERPYVSRTVDTKTMHVTRRISAAFKDIPGGQLLGVTRDYSHRLLDASLNDRNSDAEICAATAVEQFSDSNDADRADDGADKDGADSADEPLGNTNGGNTGGRFSCVPFANPSGALLPKVSEYLVAQGLMEAPTPDETEPCDVTMEPLQFPAPRSARLQTLARGMTQAVLSLGYAAIRGFGPAHPTVGELRSGAVELLIDHPVHSGDDEEAYYLGAIAVTEVESLFETEKDEYDGCDESPHSLELDIGYGLVFGRGESKAIAMSVLDYCLVRGGTEFPTEDEEFVLYHVDGVEATGFISHLKLPHYVTFQSKLNSVRKTQPGEERSHASAL